VGAAESACFGENTLGELIEGRLPQGSVAALEDHLAHCSACCALVAQMTPSLVSAERGTDLAATAPASDVRGAAHALSWLEPGTRVGRYVIEEPVGSGAMGAVYAAHDPDLDRRVALKLLRSEASGEELRARLLREAKAMARLSHPDVITVHDVGTYGRQLFVAMEFVRGGTLRRWLGDRARSWREVVAVFVRAGRGLASAHAAGLVHRDFKPDNVLVGDDGRVRVTDFGLARATARDEGEPESQEAVDATARDPLDATITRTGALVGTPAYMAPEQLRGAPADARADMFGFCVAFYEALYGERPFEGRTLLDLRASTSQGAVRPVPRGSRVPARLRKALLGGLRPKPEDRYASMDALLDAVEIACRRPARNAIAGAVLAIAVGGSVVLGVVVSSSGARPPAASPSDPRTAASSPASSPAPLPPAESPSPEVAPVQLPVLQAPIAPAPASAAPRGGRAPVRSERRPVVVVAGPASAASSASAAVAAPPPRLGNNGAPILQ
jgi:serine/threonine protein kinase